MMPGPFDLIVILVIVLVLFLMRSRMTNHSNSKIKNKKRDLYIPDDFTSSIENIKSEVKKQKELEELERKKGRISKKEKNKHIQDKMNKLKSGEFNNLVKKQTVITDYFRHRHLKRLKAIKELAQYIVMQKTLTDDFFGTIDDNKVDLDEVSKLQAIVDGKIVGRDKRTKIKKLLHSIEKANIENKKSLKKIPKKDRLIDEQIIYLSDTLKMDSAVEFIDYCEKKANKFNVGIGFLDYPLDLNIDKNEDNKRASQFKSDLIVNNRVTRRLFLAKIKSNINAISYVQIGTSFETDLSLLSNDVVDVVEIYKDVEIESNIALALQYQLLRKYRPDNYIAEDEFSEFERFDGYTEIVPMKYKTEVCKDIENVVDNYEDVKFVFKNLVLLNDLNS